MTPSLNPTLNITQDCPDKVVTMTTGLSDDHGHNIGIFSAGMVDYHAAITSSPSETSPALLLASSNRWPNDQSLSGSTVDTILPTSPSDSEPLPPKTNNLQLARSNVMLKPHQGRNPTVDRNTHKRSDEELTVSGNQLVATGTSSPPGGVHGFESVSDDLETSLVQNDALSHGRAAATQNDASHSRAVAAQNDAVSHHRVMPIPYLQNQVHGDRESHVATATTQPKVANLPGNHNSVPYRQLQQGGGVGKSIRGKVGRFFKAKKDFGAKLPSLNLFKSKSQSPYHHRGDVEQDVDDDDDVQRPLNPTPNTDVHVCETEVHLQRGGHVCTRPSNLTLQNTVLTQPYPGRAVSNVDSLRSNLVVHQTSGGGATSNDNFQGESSSASLLLLSRNNCSQSESQTVRKSVVSSEEEEDDAVRNYSDSVTGTTTNVRESAKSNSCNSRHKSRSIVTDLAKGLTSNPESRLGFAEVGIAKLRNIGHQPILKQKGSCQSRSASNLSPPNGRDSNWQELKLFDSIKKPRPTSLSLCSNGYHDDENVVSCNGAGLSAPNVSLKASNVSLKASNASLKASNGDDTSCNSREKIRRRVKTPVHVKESKTRWSLYDDRLMTHDGDSKKNNRVALRTTSQSLHQLKHYGIVSNGSETQVV